MGFALFIVSHLPPTLLSNKKNLEKESINMRILDIIENKKNKKELSKEEIQFFIKGYTSGEITDYQAAALIMAMYLNGMSNKETADLTIAMAYSGDTLDLSSLNEIIVDKHSTGGVGDKVSLILLPIISSLGIPVAKMSGRGLGFTGGTVDKLQSIPGYNTNLTTEEFIKQVKEIGISMISQTLNLAPADKKIYALRDSIACVDSISLIASSIMSKKIASGAQKILIDVTVGSGAFMKNIKDAKKLASEIIEIGKLANRETLCVLTNMDEPLGYAVGNNLEVIEAINFLKGEVMPEDLKKVVLELGAYMIKLAGKGENLENSKQAMLESINNKKAYNKFLELVKHQGGDTSYIENVENFEKAKFMKPIYSEKSGNIAKINAEEIGKLANFLGAGREKMEDKIDDAVGIVLSTKVGRKVQKDDVIAYIYANDMNKLELASEKIKDIIKITEDPVRKNKMILDVIM